MDNEDCNSNNTLTPDSVLCLVCQGILIKPIKLPCNHHVCLECLQRICDNSNLSCPMCRKRLSIWLRRNKDFSLLIDENLWNQIQKYYKKEVDQKLFDQDDGVWENLILNPTTHRQMYTPGELKAEYTKYIEKLEAERKQKELEEQEKSLQLIRQLEKEEEEKRKAEEAQRLLLEKQDEEYAKSLLEMETLSPPHDTPKTRSQAKALSAKRTETRSKRKSTNSADASRSKNQFGPIDVFCIRSNSPSMFSPQQPSTSRHNQQSKPAQKRKSTITGPLDSFYVRGSSANKRRCTTSSPTSSRCSSPDSIECELNYFKPIKLVPKTPPKGSDTQSQPIVVLPKFNTSPNQIDSAKQLTGTNQNTSDIKSTSQLSMMDIDLPTEDTTTATSAKTSSLTNLNRTILQSDHCNALSSGTDQNLSTNSNSNPNPILNPSKLSPNSNTIANMNPNSNTAKTSPNANLNPNSNTAKTSPNANPTNPNSSSVTTNPLFGTPIRTPSLGNNKLILNNVSHWSRNERLTNSGDSRRQPRIDDVTNDGTTRRNPTVDDVTNRNLGNRQLPFGGLTEGQLDLTKQEVGLTDRELGLTDSNIDNLNSRFNQSCSSGIVNQYASSSVINPSNSSVILNNNPSISVTNKNTSGSSITNNNALNSPVTNNPSCSVTKKNTFNTSVTNRSDPSTSVNTNPLNTSLTNINSLTLPSRCPSKLISQSNTDKCQTNDMCQRSSKCHINSHCQENPKCHSSSKCQSNTKCQGNSKCQGNRCHSNSKCQNSPECQNNGSYGKCQGNSECHSQSAEIYSLGSNDTFQTNDSHCQARFTRANNSTGEANKALFTLTGLNSSEESSKASFTRASNSTKTQFTEATSTSKAQFTRTSNTCDSSEAPFTRGSNASEAHFTRSMTTDPNESYSNRQEIEHFFNEFKKISLASDEEECFSRILFKKMKLSGVSPSVSSRGVACGSSVASRGVAPRVDETDDDTDVEDVFFKSPRKPRQAKCGGKQRVKMAA